MITPVKYKKWLNLRWNKIYELNVEIEIGHMRVFTVKVWEWDNWSNRPNPSSSVGQHVGSVVEYPGKPTPSLSWKAWCWCHRGHERQGLDSKNDVRKSWRILYFPWIRSYARGKCFAYIDSDCIDFELIRIITPSL